MGSGILRNGKIKLVFEATSARAHIAHAPRLKAAGIIALDLTPAAVGPGVIPVVNIHERFTEPNVNLVSCGAQATVPIVAAINGVSPVQYAETVSTIASRSAGPGTRHNIDEFTRTTARSICDIGGAKKSKSIIVLNPAEPPIIMRNTIYAVVDLPADEGHHEAVMSGREDQDICSRVQDHSEPFLDGDHIDLHRSDRRGRLSAPYSGNLDIITAAAINVAEGAS